MTLPVPSSAVAVLVALFLAAAAAANPPARPANPSAPPAAASTEVETVQGPLLFVTGLVQPFVRLEIRVNDAVAAVVTTGARPRAFAKDVDPALLRDGANSFEVRYQLRGEPTGPADAGAPEPPPAADPIELEAGRAAAGSAFHVALHRAAAASGKPSPVANLALLRGPLRTLASRAAGGVSQLVSAFELALPAAPDPAEF